MCSYRRLWLFSAPRQLGTYYYISAYIVTVTRPDYFIFSFHFKLTDPQGYAVYNSNDRIHRHKCSGPCTCQLSRQRGRHLESSDNWDMRPQTSGITQRPLPRGNTTPDSPFGYSSWPGLKRVHATHTHSSWQKNAFVQSWKQCFTQMDQPDKMSVKVKSQQLEDQPCHVLQDCHSHRPHHSCLVY